MNRVDRVHEQGGSSDGTQRGGDFPGDDAALAHAGDDDAAAAGIHEFYGAVEGVGHGTADAVGERPQRFGFNADYVFAGVLHGKEDVIKTGPGRCRERKFLDCVRLRLTSLGMTKQVEEPSSVEEVVESHPCAQTVQRWCTSGET